MTTPGAIVLAAGEGRRMGGPKALLVVDGAPLIRRHVERLCDVGCRPIVVVVRSSFAFEARALLADVPEARIVEADTPSPAASLTAALRTLGPERERVFVVTPVDMIPARRTTIDALLASVTSDGARIATPHHRGRSGHPVVIRESVLRVFREGHDGTLRDVIRAEAAHRFRLEVDDPAVAGDLDTPADLRTLRAGVVPCFGMATR